MTTTIFAECAEVEKPPVEVLPASIFTWRIEKFSKLNTQRYYSSIFVVGCYKWRVLIFPKGNNVDHLSMYLEVLNDDAENLANLPYAQFSLAVVNQIHNEYTTRKDTGHQFTARKSAGGFTWFMPLSILYDPVRGYLVNDTCIVETHLYYWTYDSRKETGYVGLKNQGATGYLNTLVQTLYHIPYFRKAVYHMPTTEDEIPSASITLALQRLFYKLQYSSNCVATKELTNSFGWDRYDCLVQHDVQELNKVLREVLEDRMKGTVVEGTMQLLFEGHCSNYIECINVDYISTRKQSFYDLQLDVKGCRDVYDSFDKYVEVEHLQGNTKFLAEQHGLQDARKGVLFIDFPPVLQFHLKRCEYDMQDTMVKINDRYEFPLQLDLDRENGKYLSPDADRRVRNLYTLHSVWVHSGLHDGHYYAIIRPALSDQLFKFDDERVTEVDIKRALEELYGGEEELPQTNPGFNNTPFKFTKYSNAYVLVYVRETDMEKIICNVDEKDVAEHLRIRLKKEQEEKERNKEKPEGCLYAIIKVARNEDLFEQIGRDIYFELVDHDKVRSFRVHKQVSFYNFKEEIAKEFGVPVQLQRFWLWGRRQNHTYRPCRPLTHQEEPKLVGQLKVGSNKAHNAELNLFLEVELGLDLYPIPPPNRTNEDILLFFKLYDPEKEELRYVGRLFVKGSGKPVGILRRLSEMAGFAPDEEIELYEEIKFEPTVMCDHIDKKLTFRASLLQDGDIICFQKPSPVGSQTKFRHPDVPSFLEYVHNRQVVHFRSLENPKKDDFCLELSKVFTYDEVTERVARHLGLEDSAKIRLTSHNCYSQQPKPKPIKYQGVDHLSDMLVHYNQTSDILYYEVLDIPLPELQGLKTPMVDFHHATKDEVGYQTPTTKNDMPSGSIPLQSDDAGSVKPTEAPVAEMDPVPALVPMSKMPTELDGQINEPMGLLVEASTEVQFGLKPDEVMLPALTTQSGEIMSLPQYPSAGQLFENGRHRQGTPDEKNEDIGGFSVLKTQASLYKQIWLKYGHIATNHVLTDSYSTQVTAVTEIMNYVMDMHQRRISEVSSEMIDSWEKKIKMAEKLEFNIRWLREHFEDVKKDFYGEQKVKTVVLEEDQSLREAKMRFMLAEDELKKAQENLSALETRFSSLHLEKQMYLEKGSHLVLDGLV